VHPAYVGYPPNILVSQVPVYRPVFRRDSA
jgi:hypothetical protein